MKRIITVILCFALAAAMAVSVNAATGVSLSASADSVYRGDTFTVSVYLSNNQPLTNGSIRVTAGEGLTLLGGSCNISGVTIGSVSGNGMCSFAFDTGVEQAVSGTIFTLRFQVNENASFESCSISASASLQNMNTTVYGGSAGTSVTVSCKHSFGSGAKLDSETHQLTCEHCGEVSTEKHTFTAHTDKPANCKEPGSETLTCSTCGESKTQPIPKTDTHTYDNWVKVSDSQHKHVCSVCGKEETTAHTWDSGKVTKAATCIATGTRTRTCTGCKITKTETISKSTSHPFSNWKRVDDDTHTRSCPVCKKVETTAHRFDNWSHDEANHYKVCTGCDQRSEQAAHVPGPEATETTDQVCTVCQRVLKPNTAHVHVFEEAWKTDETYHWHGCTQCEEKQGLSVHAYTNDCDPDCDVCGAVRQPPHAPEDVWSHDKDSHWYVCAECSEKLQQAPHTAGEAATLRNAQSCTVCEAELSPRLTHDIHDFSGQHSHICECGEVHTDSADCQICKDARDEFPWWWIAIGGEAVLLGAAVTLLLIRRERKIEEE